MMQNKDKRKCKNLIKEGQVILQRVQKKIAK